jgi:NarL family two-component system response regulator LiaR
MNESKSTLRLVIADDHPTTRAGIRAILAQASDLLVIGEAQDGFEAQRLVAELKPHILLLDLQMLGPRPAEVEKWVRTHYPETITLVLTAHERDAYLASMADAGAAGFLSKSRPPEQLIAAIRRAAHGEILFDSEQLARIRRWREEVGQRWYSLTEREREVLTLIAQGKTDQQIADELHLHVKTAKNHVSNILHKLNVATRTEAAVWAIHEGFVDGPVNL